MISHEVAISPSHWVELHSSQDLDGIEGSTSNLTQVSKLQLLPSWYTQLQLLAVLHGPFHRASHNKTVCFPQCEWREGTKERVSKRKPPKWKPHLVTYLRSDNPSLTPYSAH